MTRHVSHAKGERDHQNDGKAFGDNGHKDGDSDDELLNDDFL